MTPDLADQLWQLAGGVLGDSRVQLVLALVAGYVALVWLATAWWAFQDARARTGDPLAPWLAMAWIVVANPIGFPVGLLVYRLVRPGDSVHDRREQTLTMRALQAAGSAPACPACAARVADNWVRCPACGATLAVPCPACRNLVALDWEICPWCVREVEPGLRALPISWPITAPVEAMPRVVATQAGESGGLPTKAGDRRLARRSARGFAIAVPGARAELSSGRVAVTASRDQAVG